MVEPVRIGLLGLGTVGSGVAEAMHGSAGQPLAQAAGRPIDIASILVRDLSKPRHVEIDPRLLTTDPGTVLDDPEVELVVEVLGGEHPAVDYIERALRAGKHVVTANKEVLAKHGPRLFAVARENGVQLRFEASVGGGIPVMASLRALVAANRITQIRAIINGTTNYILTQMAEAGQSFADALRNAQELGYAEPDPTADVEGYDAVYKLSVLTGICLGRAVHPDQIGREGITGLQAADLRHAAQNGYVIKLLAIGRRDENGIEARVAPVMLPASDLLAGVRDVFNAVQVDGDLVGRVLLSGRGAGPGPTASAILGDVAGVLAGAGSDPLIGVGGRDELPVHDGRDTPARYYLRQPVVASDAAGALERLTNALGAGRISHATIDEAGDIAELVAFIDASANELLAQLEQLGPARTGQPSILRVEH